MGEFAMLAVAGLIVLVVVVVVLSLIPVVQEALENFRKGKGA